MVAAYLGYKAPAVSEAGDDEPGSDSGDGLPPVWAQSMGVIPGPDAARQAQTTEDAVTAYERMFFGEIKDVEQL